MTANGHTNGTANGTSDDTIFPVVDKIPTFDNVEEHRKWLLDHMAGAFRVFARKGYCAGVAGHISVRDPENPNTFWLNPLGYHFATLKASDMVLVDEEGNVIGGSRLPVNKAGFRIHGAIHKARPDVNAACHTHSIYGKSYSAFGKPLDMINQDVCIFYENHCVYNDFGGVVLSADEGDHIAKALGNNAGVILQNHGILTVGGTPAEAAALFVLMENSCQAQLLADASRFEPKIIDNKVAAFTRDATAYPDALYAEFIPDYTMELQIDSSFKN